MKRDAKEDASDLAQLEGRQDRLLEVLGAVLRYESVTARRNGLESASWEEGVPILPDALNRHPLLLNVLNGTLDLERCELREHRREHLLTQMAPVVFDARATCPRFEAFVREILPADDVRRFVQRLYGYSLTGLVVEHALPFLYGPGGNGKSTLINSFMSVLGTDYSGPATPKLLIKRGRDEHLTEIADLFGKRLVAVSESGEHAGLDEEKVKYLTGGDVLKARRMREDLWSFAPTHKFWFQSNYLPKIEGTDEGIWRRVLQIPFTVRPQTVDKHLGEKLAAEASGILRWGIDGLREYMSGGLAPPEQVLAATKRYREDQDVIGRFLAECVVLDPSGRMAASALYGSYKQWCSAAGEAPLSTTAFGRRLDRPGLRKMKSGGVFYEGGRLVR